MRSIPVPKLPRSPFPTADKSDEGLRASLRVLAETIVQLNERIEILEAREQLLEARKSLLR